jgi:hypothetical protein
MLVPPVIKDMKKDYLVALDSANTGFAVVSGE